MQEVFSHLWIVIVYVLGVLSLSYHLMHGFQSAFQSLGWNHPKYTPFIKTLGIGFFNRCFFAFCSNANCNAL